jgi:hypothetical protein
MKNSIAILALIILSTFSVFAQNMTPSIDYKGHIIHENKQVGSISSKGGFDGKGKKICQTDRNGNVSDMDGNLIGKGPDGNMFDFTYNGVVEKYTISEPTQDGMTEVKNSSGKTVLQLHKDFKKQSVCAVHCLYHSNSMPGQK